MFDKDRSKDRIESEAQEEVSVDEPRETSGRQDFEARCVS